MKIFINRAIAYMNRKFHFLYFGLCSLVENFYLRLIGVQISEGGSLEDGHLFL